MGDVAASGGYYIAAPAHAIVAQPGTITGSIGVVDGQVRVEGRRSRSSASALDAVSDGRCAEIYSPFQPFTPDERARIEEQMQATYELFLSRVAEGRAACRPRRSTRWRRGACGRAARRRASGSSTSSAGSTARSRLRKEKAKLDSSKLVDLVVYPQPRSVYEMLSNPFGMTIANGLEVFFRRPEARVVPSVVSGVMRFRRGEPLMVMPNVFWRER